nr:hypothetical protein [Gammaproteobacteria bacterium]
MCAPELVLTFEMKEPRLGRAGAGFVLLNDWALFRRQTPTLHRASAESSTAHSVITVWLN